MSANSYLVAGMVLVGLAVAPAALRTAGSPRTGPRIAAGTAVDSLLQRLHADHQRLAAEFARASDRANAKKTPIVLASFLQTEVLPYLQSEAVVLYPAIDSVVGTKGYATTAALFEQEQIVHLANEIGARMANGTLEGRSQALTTLLGNYFDKECLLILPILGNYLSDKDLRALIVRLDAGRVKSPVPTS